MKTCDKMNRKIIKILKLSGMEHELYAAKRIEELESKVDELKDFAIWMTGCGYDFCQHPYFIERRDTLLKDA